MSEDLFDVALDLTWANNSALDAVKVRFDEGIPVRGTDVGFVPVNADVPHNWKDVLGVRVGGDVVALPNLLAFRAGGFFETRGQDDASLNLDFHLGWRAGVAAGATVRIGPVDVSAAYQHTFFGTLDNGGDGEIKALSGDASTGFRSVQSVNGGRLESSLDEVALGATLRF
jgi:long-chain fatty acid transport protein